MALINLPASLSFEVAQACSTDKLYYETSYSTKTLDSNDSGISEF